MLNFSKEVDTTHQNLSLGLNETFPLSSAPKIRLFMLVIATIVAVLTVILNGMVVVFFSCRKSLRKSSFNMQVLVLSSTDMLIGITLIPTIVAYVTEDILTSLCGITLSVFLVMQLFGLSTVLGICIQRMIITFSLRTFVSKWKKKYFQFHCAAASVILPLIVVVVFIKDKVAAIKLPICDMYRYFGDNRLAATVHIQACFLLMQLATDVIYVCLWVRLWMNVKKSLVRVVRNKNSSSGTATFSGLSKGPEESPASERQRMGSREVVCTSIPDYSDQSEEIPDPENQHTKSGQATRLPNSEQDSKQNSHQVALPFRQCKISFASPELMESKHEVIENKSPGLVSIFRQKFKQNPSASVYTSTSTLQMQKRSLITVGILLSFYNVCLFPINYASSRDIFSVNQIKRNDVTAFTALMAGNSFINVFVYAFRTPELQRLLVQTWRRLWTWRRA